MASAQSSDGDSDVEGAAQQAPGDEAAFSDDESLHGDENDDDSLPTQIQPPPQVGPSSFDFDVTSYSIAVPLMISHASYLLCFDFLTLWSPVTLIGCRRGSAASRPNAAGLQVDGPALRHQPGG